MEINKFEMKKYRIGKFHCFRKNKRNKTLANAVKKRRDMVNKQSKKGKRSFNLILASQQFLEANFNILGTW